MSDRRKVIITWIADDVQAIRPSWSIEKCEEALADNANRLVDRSIELGWDVLDILIGPE